MEKCTRSHVFGEEKIFGLWRHFYLFVLFDSIRGVYSGFSPRVLFCSICLRGDHIFAGFVRRFVRSFWGFLRKLDFFWDFFEIFEFFKFIWIFPILICTKNWEFFWNLTENLTNFYQVIPINVFPFEFHNNFTM